MPLDQPTAARFAQLALDCVHREYPNKVAHTLASDADVLPPRVLTPAFYGCFDWHSAVHGHWMLARLARVFPESPFAGPAKAALARNITRENIAAEVRYLETPGRTAFERPYGLAWLLQLAAELRNSNADLARILEPLERAGVAKLAEWLPKLSHPDRSGQHANTAFALGLAIDSLSAPWLREHARRFYEHDRNGPIAFEPSGEDFLSPCLAEADLMRRVYPPQQFAIWLADFLPDFGGIEPVTSPDPSDGKLAHLDGLNLSRAWMLRGIAHSLSANDARRAPLLAIAEAHRRAGLAAVTGQHYEGGHWLGTFAVYLETAGAAVTEVCNENLAGASLSQLQHLASEEKAMANPFVHVELNTSDPNKAKTFYSKLFQWQLEDVPNPVAPTGTYTMVKTGTGTGGGIMQQVPGGPAGWLAYVEVDDIHDATQKAKSLGGKVMKDVTEVTGMGWFSFIQDPTGAVLGLWKSKPK